MNTIILNVLLSLGLEYIDENYLDLRLVSKKWNSIILKYFGYSLYKFKKQEEYFGFSGLVEKDYNYKYISLKNNILVKKYEKIIIEDRRKLVLYFYKNIDINLFNIQTYSLNFCNFENFDFKMDNKNVIFVNCKIKKFICSGKENNFHFVKTEVDNFDLFYRNFMSFYNSAPFHKLPRIKKIWIFDYKTDILILKKNYHNLSFHNCKIKKFIAKTINKLYLKSSKIRYLEINKIREIHEDNTEIKNMILNP